MMHHFFSDIIGRWIYSGRYSRYYPPLPSVIALDASLVGVVVAPLMGTSRGESCEARVVPDEEALAFEEDGHVCSRDNMLNLSAR